MKVSKQEIFNNKLSLRIILNVYFNFVFEIFPKIQKTKRTLSLLLFFYPNVYLRRHMNVKTSNNFILKRVYMKKKIVAI